MLRAARTVPWGQTLGCALVTPRSAARSLLGMNSPLSPRRLIVGAAIATTVLVAVPSLASASTCRNTSSLGQVDVFDTSGAQPLVIKRSGQFIGVADGDFAPMTFCDGPQGFSTVTNANTIVVRTTTASGGGGLKIDQSGGLLAPGQANENDGANEIEVLTDSAHPTGRLVVTGTSGPDTIKVGSGGGVNLGGDLEVDIRARNAGSIEVQGLGGNDFITGRGTFPNTKQPPADRSLTLLGGAGADTLVDGLNFDFLRGEAGDDTLFSVDGTQDILFGGANFDRATMESFDADGDSTIESKSFGSVGKLRLAPAIVDAKAGTTARMKMSWTHPKAWQQLRKIAVRVYDGSALVKRIVVRPRQAEHHGKTVSADLKLKLPKALAGHTLRVDVEATDRKGHRQLEPSAGLVNL